VQTKSWQKDFRSINSLNKEVKYKVLLLNQNSLDSYMIEKFLPKDDGFYILRASTILEALKILNYVKIDIVIIDDKFDQNIKDILTKLSLLQSNCETSVMILLSNEYEKSLVEKFSNNIDFIKKPIDENIFKHRVNLNLIKKSSNLSRSYFTKVATTKLEQFRDSISIYHDIFNNDEQMMLIFDPKKSIFLESNLSFEKNFTNIDFLNRIINNKRIYREFFPYIDNPSYINNYDLDTFLKIVDESLDFNYSLKVKNSFKEYSFTTIFKDIYVDGNRYYLIKLIDLYDYIDSDKKNSNISLKESNLSSFKDDFLSLRGLLTKESFKNKKDIKDLLYKISSKLSIVCDDEKIIDDFKIHDLNDIYKILVNKGLEHQNMNIKINSKDVSSLKSEDTQSDFLAKIDENLFLKFLSLLFENSSNDIDILIYNTKDTIIVEYSYNSEEKFIKKDNLKEYLNKLGINMEIVNENEKIIVVINIPKNI